MPSSNTRQRKEVAEEAGQGSEEKRAGQDRRSASKGIQALYQGKERRKAEGRQANLQDSLKDLFKEGEYKAIKVVRKEELTLDNSQLCPVSATYQRVIDEACAKSDCMYNVHGCSHPQVSGLSENQILEKKGLLLGLTAEQVTARSLAAQARIEGALLLHTYLEWVRGRHIVAPSLSPARRALLTQGLNGKMLQCLAPELRLQMEEFDLMCRRDLYKKWSAETGCKRSWEDVSEMETSVLMRIRASHSPLF